MAVTLPPLVMTQIRGDYYRIRKNKFRQVFDKSHTIYDEWDNEFILARSRDTLVNDIGITICKLLISSTVWADCWDSRLRLTDTKYDTASIATA